jgi:hypothetical protein
MKQNSFERSETQVSEETKSRRLSPHWLYTIKGVFAGLSTLLRPSSEFFYRRKKTRADGSGTETIIRYKVD